MPVTSEAEWEPAKRKKKKKKKSTKKKSANEQGPSFATLQEADLGTQPELEPELEPQPAVVMQPMSEWSVADVGGWIEGLLPSLGAEWASAFVKLELDGDELADMKTKSLQKQLRFRQVSDPAEAATAILALRDQVLASMPGLEEAEAAPDASADGNDDDLVNVLLMKERLGNQKLMQSRAQALKACDEGFAIPIRRVGDIDCETRKVKLHASVPVEGALGRSALQELVISEWHPMRVVVTGGDAVEVINREDIMLQVSHP